MAAGGQEPSTGYDISSLMFPEPSLSGGKIYFQAFQSVDQLTVNPNVAATDSRLLPPGAVAHRAMLGHWRDCNQDGYVGLAESAIQDYSAALLLDLTTCPTGTPYNDGQWVSEMIGIGMVDPCEMPEHRAEVACAGVDAFHPNERVFYAPGTMVWGDVGEPGGIPPGECPVEFAPTTTSGTGALLGHVDCQDGRRVAVAVNAVDEDGSRGLRFEDEDHPERSSSLLNVFFPVSLFGGPQGAGILEADTGAPSATVWDCSERKAVDIKDPTGLGRVTVTDPSGNSLTGPQPTLPVVGVVTLFANDDENGATPGTRTVAFADAEGSIFWVPMPAPSVDDPTGSWWDAAEAAADGPAGDCTSASRSALRPAYLAPIVESGEPQVDSARKDRTSFAFTFYDGHRGLNERVDFALGSNATSDGGLLYMRHGRGGDGPLWSADAASANEPQLVTRGSLAVSSASFWTYYATIGTDALTTGFDIPGPVIGNVYGGEVCGSQTTGVHGGWLCDASLWWRDALGRDVRPRYAHGEAYAPVPGQRYHLRDVDCYDGHAAAGLYASGALLSERLCV